MNPSFAPMLSKLDVSRLEKSVLGADRRRVERDAALLALEERLDAALVVAASEVAPDVVTMNSRVTLEAPDGRRHTVTLVYPPSADATSGRVSVLAPLGRALLGARVGEVARFEVPGWPPRELRIIGIDYQPESAGDFDL